MNFVALSRIAESLSSIAKSLEAIADALKEPRPVEPLPPRKSPSTPALAAF
jgi:hypothetical protein